MGLASSCFSLSLWLTTLASDNLSHGLFLWIKLVRELKALEINFFY